MDFCATPGMREEIMWLIDAASSATPATPVSDPTASTSGYSSTAASISTVERSMFEV